MDKPEVRRFHSITSPWLRELLPSTAAENDEFSAWRAQGMGLTVFARTREDAIATWTEYLRENGRLG